MDKGADKSSPEVGGGSVDEELKSSPENPGENRGAIVNSAISSNTEVKSNNPFLESERETPQMPDTSARQKIELDKFPFKTLNRILDDIKYTIPYKLQCTHSNSSLLNSKPIDYSGELCRVAMLKSSLARYQMLVLNNSLDFAPSIEKFSLPEHNHELTVLRGLIVNDKEINHFRISILETVASEFVTANVDKHEYHIIPSSILSKIEQEAFLQKTDHPNYPENIIDDAYFKSRNGPNNHTIRVSIFTQEFSDGDLEPLYNQNTISQRYLDQVDKYPDSNISRDTIPTSTHCFKTLIKVLKGPILLPEGESIKTINANNLSLNSQLNINLLFDKLSFTLKEEELIPPDISRNSYLRESYIRKIMEAIYLAKIFGDSPNEFDTTYSFDDNLSLIYRTFNEFDRHLCQTYGRSHESNELSFCINLSICTYFQDELLIKCFENTVRYDSENKMRYVDSLKSLTKYRSNQNSSRKLKTYYNNLSQRGELIGLSDYENALRAFNIDVNAIDTTQLKDDSISAMYMSCYKNDPKNYTYFNKLLRLIAKARESEYLNDFIVNEILPVNIAIDELGIEEITEDEVVITAYEFKLNDLLTANSFNVDSSEVSFLNKSLLSVATNRKSYSLMSYIEIKLPQLIQAGTIHSYDESMKHLGCTPDTNDFEIIVNFQNKLAITNDALSIRNLRQCLKLIATRRNSKILESFLKTGKIDSSLLPAENWPAGLDNIGNTCYLNSLLQYYFCIKPLRDMILTFSEFDVCKDKQKGRKIGGRNVEDSEIQRSNQFIYHLRTLFNEMIHTKKRCVQPSKDLAYLSFLPLSQPVDFAPDVSTSDRNIIEISDDEADGKIARGNRTGVGALSSHGMHSPISVDSSGPDDNDVEVLGSEDALRDEEMESSSVEEIEPPLQKASEEKKQVPKILPISTDQMESTIEVGRQQDVTECIENVTFQIETALEPEYLEDDKEQFDLIKRLFYGRTKQTITPLDPENAPRVNYERFFSLIINISDHPKDIYDSLDNYFSEDIVKLEEGLAKKSLTVSKLPEVLQFHVQRVLFDRERLMAYKSLEQIPFSEKIYLDRYLDTTDEEILQKRSEVFKWKSEMASLRENKLQLLRVDESTNSTILDSLYATKKYLESKVMTHETLSINPSTIITIQEQIDLLEQKIKDIDAALESLNEKVAAQFRSYTRVGYSIFAVFIHRGEASYGHYWVYIKDPHKDIFRKYNDENVTEVPLSEVMDFSGGTTATPYYIVYVKDSLEQDYIEPLKRVIHDSP